MEGWGYKKRTTTLPHVFQRRYFRLEAGSHELEYSKTPNDVKTRGCINCRTILHIAPISAGDLGTSKVAKACGPYGMSILMEGRVFHLLWENETDRLYWLSAIVAAAAPVSLKLHPSYRLLLGMDASPYSASPKLHSIKIAGASDSHSVISVGNSISAPLNYPSPSLSISSLSSSLAPKYILDDFSLVPDDSSNASRPSKPPVQAEVETLATARGEVAAPSRLASTSTRTSNLGDNPTSEGAISNSTARPASTVVRMSSASAANAAKAPLLSILKRPGSSLPPEGAAGRISSSKPPLAPRGDGSLNGPDGRAAPVRRPIKFEGKVSPHTAALLSARNAMAQPLLAEGDTVDAEEGDDDDDDDDGDEDEGEEGDEDEEESGDGSRSPSSDSDDEDKDCCKCVIM